MLGFDARSSTKGPTNWDSLLYLATKRRKHNFWNIMVCTTQAVECPNIN
jgi:hypothetical protein